MSKKTGLSDGVINHFELGFGALERLEGQAGWLRPGKEFVESNVNIGIFPKKQEFDGGFKKGSYGGVGERCFM